MELPGLIHVCHDPILDYVVLSKRFAAGHLASFSLVDAPSLGWHVYDCAALRTLTDPYAHKLPSP